MKIKDILFRDGFFLGIETIYIDGVKIKAKHTKKGVIVSNKDYMLLVYHKRSLLLDDAMKILNKYVEQA